MERKESFLKEGSVYLSGHLCKLSHKLQIADNPRPYPTAKAKKIESNLPKVTEYWKDLEIRPSSVLSCSFHYINIKFGHLCSIVI
jgi:hypothetical protein